SMGAIFQMNIAYYETFADYQKAFPKHLLYPFMLQTEHYLDEMTFEKKPSSLVFGPESSGLDDSYLALGTPIKIRQSSKIDSFNLQVSVSVACYEFMKNKK
ncbi:MAG: TrmH family RNA methyltransferase, partial [Firmicutes bacterium]|nr:TrmH family RNA methyltransferase [Bacillota bacterium]